MNAVSNAFRRALPGPPLYVRLPVYLGLWLVNGAVLVFAVPQFKPIFDKFEKNGDLPDPTRWMIAFVQINQIGYCVPLFAVVAAFLAFDAGIGAILRQPKHGKSLIWFWFLAACCVLVGLFLLMVCGLLLPVFKMSGAVG